MSGRTVWWAKDAAWWRREAVVELLEEFGPAGPAVLDWLTCEAKAQGSTGDVKAGYRAIARGIGVDVVTVCPVVSRCVQLGALDDFKDSGRTFTCRISGWHDEQVRAVETVKKRRQRATASDDSPAKPPDPAKGLNGTKGDMSPTVPESPPTGQDRTEDVVAAEARARGENFANDALHPSLLSVLTILSEAKRPDGGGLLVVDASIDSQLRAKLGTLPADEQQRLALQAAHETAALVQAGSNSTSEATRLYGGVLGRVVERHRAAQRAADKPAGRQRAAARNSRGSERFRAL